MYRKLNTNPRPMPKTKAIPTKFVIQYTARNKVTESLFKKRTITLHAFGRLDAQTLLSKHIRKNNLELGVIIDFGETV